MEGLILNDTQVTYLEGLKLTRYRKIFSLSGLVTALGTRYRLAFRIFEILALDVLVAKANLRLKNQQWQHTKKHN